MERPGEPEVDVRAPFLALDLLPSDALQPPKPALKMTDGPRGDGDWEAVSAVI